MRSHSAERSRGMVVKFSARAPPTFAVQFAPLQNIHVSWAQLLGEQSYANGARLELCAEPPALCSR